MNLSALMIARSGMRNKRLGIPFEQCVFSQREALMVGCWFARACGINARCRWGGKAEPRAFRDSDVDIHAVAIKEASGGIGDVENQRALIEMTFADVDWHAEVLLGNEWGAVRPRRAFELEMSAE